MSRKLVTPTHGWFTLAGTYVGPASVSLTTVSLVWKQNGHSIEPRPVVYVRGNLKLCAGCRGRRNRTQFDIKPASRKERLFCGKCGREIK